MAQRLQQPFLFGDHSLPAHRTLGCQSWKRLALVNSLPHFTEKRETGGESHQGQNSASASTGARVSRSLQVDLMITAWRWSRDPVHLTWSRSIPEEQSNPGDGSWQWDSLEDLIAKWVSWFQVAARG